jgi:hypothetical protein
LSGVTGSQRSGAPVHKNFLSNHKLTGKTPFCDFGHFTVRAGRYIALNNNDNNKRWRQTVT